MGRTSARVAPARVATKPVIDYSRFISRIGYSHLQGTLRETRVNYNERREQLNQEDSTSLKSYSTYEQKHALISLEESIREQERFLSSAIIIEDTPQYQNLPEGEIWLGCLVSYLDLDASEVFNILLLGSKEAAQRDLVDRFIPTRDEAEDVDLGSCLTPIAQTLIGRHQGDIVEAVTPGGVRHLKILKVTRTL